MANPNNGQTVAQAWEAYVGTKPEDNIFENYWLYDQFSKGQGFKSFNGGRDARVTLEYAVNSTVKSYSDTEQLDTTRVDVFDEAEFTWREYAGTVIMSELEKAKNQGEGGKFRLLPAKLENLRMSMQKKLNEDMFSDGTGNSGKNLAGLASLVSTTPTTGTVGGINRASFSFWRNQQTSGAKTTTAYDNLRSTMRSIFNLSSNGVHGNHPHFWVTSRAVFEGYEGLLTTNERFTDKKSGDAGFKNTVLMFKGAKGAYDNDATAGELRFLHPKYIKLAYQKNYWFKGFPAVDPADQTVDVFKVMTIAQMIVTNPRMLGAVTAIT